jgi:hypothetical protein
MKEEAISAQTFGDFREAQSLRENSPLVSSFCLSLLGVAVAVQARFARILTEDLTVVFGQNKG